MKTVAFLVAILGSIPAFATLVQSQAVLSISPDVVTGEMPNDFCSGLGANSIQISLQAAKYIDANLTTAGAYVCNGTFVAIPGTVNIEVIQLTSCQPATTSTCAGR